MRNVTKKIVTFSQHFKFLDIVQQSWVLSTVVIVHAQVRTTDNLLNFLQVDPNK